MAEENKQQEAEQPEKTYSAAEYTALQQQLDEARVSLKETAEKLASFEKMDVESIRKSAADWKQKYEQSEKDRADFAYKTKLGQFVKSLHLKNDVYEKFVTDLLTEKGLQFDGDKLIGGDDIVKAFRESHEEVRRTVVSSLIRNLSQWEIAEIAWISHIFHGIGLTGLRCVKNSTNIVIHMRTDSFSAVISACHSMPDVRGSILCHCIVIAFRR